MDLSTINKMFEVAEMVAKFEGDRYSCVKWLDNGVLTVGTTYGEDEYMYDFPVRYLELSRDEIWADLNLRQAEKKRVAQLEHEARQAREVEAARQRDLKILKELREKYPDA